ncbi:hypothetical protein V8F20_000646 [Naviculisporaceae sp. PSN 640]
MDLDDAAGDSHSENISVATPPTLTTGTSVDNGGDSDDDAQMTDSSPQSPHPHNVWPTVSDCQPPLDQTIEFNTSSPSSDSHLSSLSSFSTPYRSSSPNGPRGRILKAPEETNEVRKIGACYRCRISRVKCDTSPICRKCSVDVSKVPGGDFMRKTCIRDEPSKVGGRLAARWSWKVPRFSPRRDDFIKEKRIRLRVRFLTENPSSSRGLEITATPFKDPRGSNAILYGILPEEGPGTDQIHSWVKSQITSDEKNDFESWLEELHLRFVHGNCLDSAFRYDERTPRTNSKPLSNPNRKLIETQQDLLKNIMALRCMWKVWSCEKFDVRTANNSPLPPNWDVSAIVDYIQRVAEQKLSSLEKTVLRDIDRYLSPLEIRDDRPVFKSAMNVATWIILWQMILIYRQSVIRTLVQQERDQKEPNAAPPSAKRHKFHEITERLFQGVVVMYSETFRTRKVLESLRDVNETVFGKDPSLHGVFQGTWNAREKFCMSRQVNKSAS